MHTNSAADDVSAISFGEGRSVASAPARGGVGRHGGQSPMGTFDEEGDDEDSDSDAGGSVGAPAEQLNTNEWDSKGRCVRHPHIRLRKKKMLGKGWKVLMSGE